MPQLTIKQAFDLAVQHHQAGRLHEAEQLYRQILAEQPAHSDAMHLLGVIADQTGKREIAVNLIRQAITLRPNFPDALNNLASILKNNGQLEEAIAAFQQAITFDPTLAEAHNNLGDALKDKGQLDQAIARYRQAIILKPGYAEAHNNLGIALKDKRQFDEAISAFRQAIAIRPNYAEAHSNLGNALKGNGQLDEAIAAYREAIMFKPGLSGFHNNLGNALKDKGQLDDAIAAYQQAIAIDPSLPEPHNNLGLALKSKEQLDQAAAAFRQAIALKPNYADAHSNLGIVLTAQGHLDQAIASFRQAVEVDPHRAAIHSNIPFVIHFHPDYDPQAISGELRKWQQRHAQPLRPFVPRHDNDPAPDRALNIAYISPDFRDHCQILFTLPLLRNHDRRNFRVFCYSDTASPDQMTQEVRKNADVWHNIAAMTDAQVAQLIQRDRIDILIDLTMHMADNRQLVFARKPAPVQVTWLAYPGSTGQETIDYRLTDPNLDPPGLFDARYSEKSIRLPDTFWCYDPLPAAAGDGPAAGPLPASKNGYITFGCLNNFCKVTNQTLDLWTPMMAAVPNAKLLLLAPRGQARTELLKKLQERGVASSRVQFVDRQPRNQYLELYHRIDIGLDTFPYNGHTTSLDSFWMGVPVVTMVGSTVVGRAGWSQLSNLGLTDLAAQTPAQFVSIAAALAADLIRLTELRTGLRSRMQQSPLMDAPRFARNIEAAYRRMWHNWSASPSGNI